jgi:hypothetical protein
MYKKAAGIFIISLALFGCAKTKENDEKLFAEKRDSVNTPYAIEVARVSAEDEAVEIAEGLKEKVPLKFYLEQDYKKGKTYSLKLGSFKSSYAAGREAFNLWKQVVLQTYKIKNNAAYVEDNYGRVIIVGAYDMYPILYTFNLRTGRARPFWSSGGKKIVDLSYSDDMTFAFAIGLADYGNSGNIPYFKNAIVYKIDMLDFSVTGIDTLGSGLQIYTDWENDHLYKVTSNYIDKKYSTYVVMNSKIYNKFGKVLLDEKKSFDLVKDGYPAPVKPGLSNISPDERKSVGIRPNADSVLSVFIKDVSDGGETELLSGYANIKRIEWAGDGGYLILSAGKIAVGPNSKVKDTEPDALIIYSTADKKIVEKKLGENYASFYVRGDLLFYDEGYGSSSHIVIYDLSERKEFNSIKISGGCGVRNIPEKGVY